MSKILTEKDMNNLKWLKNTKFIAKCAEKCNLILSLPMKLANN